MELKPPLEAFKDRIEFAAAPPTGADAIVVLDWNKTTEHLGLSGWDLARDAASVGNGTASRLFAFKKDQGRLEIDVYSMGDAEAARERLVELASMTMMPQIPYEKGPPIGDLSCQLPSMPERAEIIWTRANVCVRAALENAAPDEFETWCSRLDSSMAGRIVTRGEAASHAPKLGNPVAQGLPASAGGTVSVSWRIEGEEGIESRAEILPPGDEAVEVLDQEPGMIRFVVQAPGRLVLRIDAADPRWLVLDHRSLEIDVAP